MSKKTVLIIDDDEMIVQTMIVLTELLGYSSESNSGARDALNRLEKGFVPDIILMDKAMPQMSGLDAIPFIREILPETPIILITGYSNTPCPPGHNLAVLCKPFGLPELSECILENLK